MKNTFDSPAAGPQLRGSYVLRLWSTQSGDLYGYVLDVQSGIRHPLPRLAELPPLIRSLTAKFGANNAGDARQHDLE